MAIGLKMSPLCLTSEALASKTFLEQHFPRNDKLQAIDERMQQAQPPPRLSAISLVPDVGNEFSLHYLSLSQLIHATTGFLRPFLALCQIHSSYVGCLLSGQV
jgi:hypothetical protein